MKKTLQKWLGIHALVGVSSILTEKGRRADERLSNIERALRTVNQVSNEVGMTEVKQETKPVSEFTTYYLGPKGKFEVVKVSTGQFLVGQGFDTENDALAAAKELCVRYPTEEFAILGILSTVKAEIPVIRTLADGSTIRIE